MLLNNQRINDVIEALVFGVENFELAKIEQSLEQVQSYKINVDPDLLEKAYEIVDER